MSVDNQQIHAASLVIAIPALLRMRGSPKIAPGRPMGVPYSGNWSASILQKYKAAVQVLRVAVTSRFLFLDFARATIAVSIADRIAWQE
jgi:hypothetical protein